MSRVAFNLGVPIANFRQLWLETNRQRNTGLFLTREANLEYICRKSCVLPEPAAIAISARIRFEYIRKCLTPRDDTLDTLAQLRTSRYGVGLISDCTIEVADAWPDTSIAPLVDVAILSCEVGLTKPDPRIYQKACEQLQVSATKCLYIGDGGSNELTGASSFGLDAVLLRAPYDTIPGNREEWQGPKISSLKEVLALA